MKKFKPSHIAVLTRKGDGTFWPPQIMHLLWTINVLSGNTLTAMQPNRWVLGWKSRRVQFDDLYQSGFLAVVTIDDFDWAVVEATKKKKLACSSAEFLTLDEGLCVQIMHIGSFDDEPATVAIMDQYLHENGYTNDMTGIRLHHEIYLSDARKVEPSKWKTVIRHPIKKI